MDPMAGLFLLQLLNWYNHTFIMYFAFGDMQNGIVVGF